MNTLLRAFAGMLAVCPIIACAQTWHAPARGSAERAQVMSALRTELTRFDPDARNMRFAVRQLCLSQAAGWIVADPQSADGRNRYEPLSASLKRAGGQWRVDVLACTEEACPAGTASDDLRRSVNPGCH